jgi:hypothetical protein
MIYDLLVKGPRFWVESVPTGDGHVQEQIYRRADHQVRAEGTRSWVVGERAVSQAGGQRDATFYMTRDLAYTLLCDPGTRTSKGDPDQ